MSRAAPIFYGKVETGGYVHVAERRRFREYCATLEGKPVEVVVRPKRSRRSGKANAFYWSVVVPLIAEELGYDKQECHEVLAFHFLRIEDCPVTGSPRRKRTPECDSAEFARYVDQCIRLAAEHGIVVPQPGEVEVAQ